MKIERRRDADFAGLVRQGVQALVGPPTPPKSPEQQLVDQRDTKRRRFRGHWHAYLMTGLGLAAINVFTWAFVGVALPWALIPIVGWGVGFGIHALDYRAWMRDHAQAVQRAEQALGLAAPAPVPALPEGPKTTSEAPHPWGALLAACEDAVEKADRALSSVASPAHDGAATAAHLRQGLDNVRRLAQGAARVEAALQEVAPGGLIALTADIKELDGVINATSDERVREVHLANRTLLLARQAKVQDMLSDRDRMLANAKGFLLAAENLRLDAARLGSDPIEANPAALTEPLARLDEEVRILRSVEAELAKLGA